jgi:hypothetical protein
MSKRILILSAVSGILATTLPFGGTRGWRTINGIQYDSSTGQPNYVQAEESLHPDYYFDACGYGGINAAVAAIGSTPGTLVIHDPQVLTRNLTVPATLGVRILKGGSIVKASTYVPVFNGPFEAGDYQVFHGFSPRDFSSSTFGPGTVKEINPMWWGVGINADATTNTVALNCSTAALPAANGVWRLPGGSYVTNGNVTFANFSHGRITFDGMICNNTAHSNGVVFQNVNFSEIFRVGAHRNSPNWTDSAAAVAIYGTFAHNRVTYGYRSGFTYGERIEAPDNTGCGYNEFYGQRSECCKYHIYLKTNDGPSWIGASSWHGGSYTNGAYATTDDWAVYCDRGVGSIHDLSFYDGKYEALGNGFYLKSTSSVGVFGEPHFEAIARTYFDLDACHYFTYHVAAQATPFEDTTLNVTIETRGLRIEQASKYGSMQSPQNVEDAAQGGTRWLITPDSRAGSATATERAKAALTLRPVGVYGILSWESPLGNQFFDKQFVTNLADSPPTTGTYQQNAVVYNSAIESGKTIAWTCKTYGTAGILDDVRASTTKDSSVIVVNNADALRFGQAVTVAAPSSLSARSIIGINGTMITLSGLPETLDPGGQDLALSFKNPTWQAWGAYP